VAGLTLVLELRLGGHGYEPSTDLLLAAVHGNPLKSWSLPAQSLLRLAMRCPVFVLPAAA